LAWLKRLLGRGDRGAEDAAADADAPPPQELVLEVLDATGLHTVRIDTGGQRVTDALNDPKHDVNPRAVDPADGPAPAVDDFLLVVPPPQAGDPARRLHRPGQPLWARIGPYTVEGAVHPPPGAVGEAFLLRRNQDFFVLTDAHIRLRTDQGVTERWAEVVLVNLRKVESLRETPEPEREPDLADGPPMDR
jgi:hypothetical protein